MLRCSDSSFYVGVTSDLKKRIIEHQTKSFPNSYTSSRLPVELVYYEEFTDIKIAIEKEKQLKKWSRVKKEALINKKFNTLSELSKKKFE